MNEETKRIYQALRDAGWQPIDVFHWRAPDGSIERFPNAASRVLGDALLGDARDWPAALLTQDYFETLRGRWTQE